ncbi:MAG: hypothetical protein D3924_16145 [Candidatus Electrothrix sp. AR4]|nr:hypothetical protein [Candidatus Electrothrix sp. AR4]
MMNNIQSWLEEVRSGFATETPELLPQFDIYAAEAIFGREYIDRDLAHLPAGGEILEVGAGSLLLSC